MILFIECVVACTLFSVWIIGWLLINNKAWLREYSPKVQQRFLEKNPDYVVPEKRKHSKVLLVEKLIVSVVFLFILAGLNYLAGAKTWMSGMINCYIIWFVVNLYDAIVLDLGLFMNWKKIRLPGTEDMDQEYHENKLKHLKDGLKGCVIGLPVCALAGLVSSLF